MIDAILLLRAKRKVKNAGTVGLKNLSCGALNAYLASELWIKITQYWQNHIHSSNKIYQDQFNGFKNLLQKMSEKKVALFPFFSLSKDCPCFRETTRQELEISKKIFSDPASLWWVWVTTRMSYQTKSLFYQNWFQEAFSLCISNFQTNVKLLNVK